MNCPICGSNRAYPVEHEANEVGFRCPNCKKAELLNDKSRFTQ